MDLSHAIALGVVQGLTEFLPVSSSGHLVIFQHLFGMQEAELFFDICVHTGTLMAVLLFFRKDIAAILKTLAAHAGRMIRRESGFPELMADTDGRLAVFIIVGSVPTAIIGLILNRMADILFSSILLAGGMLLITGTVLWATRWISDKSDSHADFSTPKALTIGLVQGLAVLPGISRSGSTIAVGLMMGLDRSTAARFSFLLSIPAITGAQILGLKDLAPSAGLDTVTLIGAMTAGVVGYFALAFLVYIVNRGRLHYFSPYCWAAGIAAISLHFFG